MVRDPNESGGGASRSTDPALGSSSATDVSLREHVSLLVAALDRHLTSEINGLRRESQAAVSNSSRAVDVAAEEAKERLVAHNGLIEQMRQQAQQFATREAADDFKEANDKRIGRVERFQFMLTGGILLLSAIGVANLVKAWAG